MQEFKTGRQSENPRLFLKHNIKISPTQIKYPVRKIKIHQQMKKT